MKNNNRHMARLLTSHVFGSNMARFHAFTRISDTWLCSCSEQRNASPPAWSRVPTVVSAFECLCFSLKLSFNEWSERPRAGQRTNRRPTLGWSSLSRLCDSRDIRDIFSKTLYIPYTYVLVNVRSLVNISTTQYKIQQWMWSVKNIVRH